jgi:hypothetical protein
MVKSTPFMNTAAEGGKQAGTACRKMELVQGDNSLLFSILQILKGSPRFTFLGRNDRINAPMKSVRTGRKGDGGEGNHLYKTSLMQESAEEWNFLKSVMNLGTGCQSLYVYRTECSSWSNKQEVE